MKSLIRIGIVLLFPAIVAVIVYVWLNSFFFSPANPKDTKKYVAEVKQGSTFRSFCKELEAKGIIKHWRVLDIIAQVKKDDTQIQAGEYELSPSMSPQAIMAKLTSGDVLKRIVTVKEGMNIWDIAEEYHQAGIIDREDFLREVTNPILLKKIKLEARSFEGYLFPETYQFSGQHDAQSVIWTMYEQFRKRWNNSYNERLKEINFTLHEIITLASIIEKESGRASEQPMISSVFHNRLKNGMKLDSDPTLVYGLKDFNGVVLNIHKERDTLYNTYKNFGLPPGPIANPGKTAIEAALYPAESNYLFFVADGYGGHVFSQTLREHNEAVRKYRQLIKEQKKAKANES